MLWSKTIIIKTLYGEEEIYVLFQKWSIGIPRDPTEFKNDLLHGYQ